MFGEISYDLVMEDDMDFVEGCYRIDNRDWQVLIVNKKPVEKTVVVQSSWRSGASGLVIHVPFSTNINREQLKQILTEILGIEEWHEVRGPDSMQLR